MIWQLFRVNHPIHSCSDFLKNFTHKKLQAHKAPEMSEQNYKAHV